MKQLEKIISYYRDCYAADLKSVHLLNFYNKDVYKQHTFNNFDHLSDRIQNQPIDTVWGETVDQELAIHSKEKQLFTGSFFLKGKMNRIGKATSVFVPLYLHETILHFENGVYYISVDTENPIINPAFFDFLNNEIEIDPEIEKNIISRLPLGKFDFEALINLKSLIEATLPQIDTVSISTLIAEGKPEIELKKIAASKSKNFHLKLIAGSAIGLVQKSKGARGIIQELDLIRNQPQGSGLLNLAFGIEKEANEILPQNEIYTPSSLSESQQKAIHSLHSNKITLVIGPPGTGKTFTIANIAANLIAEGKSALIVCKTAQATSVVMDKIQKELGLKGKVINATTQRYKRSLKSKLNNIIYGFSKGTSHSFNSKAARSELKSISADIGTLVKNMMDSEKDEIKWGELYFSDKNKFVKLFLSKWLEYKKSKKESISLYADTLHKLENLKRKKSKRFILGSYDDFLTTSLKHHRKDFVTLIEALDQKIGNLIHDKFDEINFQLILKALPIWISTTDKLHNALPLQEGLFDVVIIDEATQCDIPSAIPLLYRAKKLIAVGDPKQLRHISFLSKSQEMAMLSKYSTNQDLPLYRTNSILDLINLNIAHQNQVVFLNEHYRSTPSIIRFSNKHFYDQSLHIMTDTPSNLNEGNGLSLIKTEGKRNTKGVNEIEAESILSYIANVILEESELEKKFKSTIGILSPFRAQVDFIKKSVREKFSLNEIKKHLILVGTPHHFQGEERDIMCLSFALNNDSHHSSFQYLNKEDVFNVSITRARKKQIAFTSLDHKHMAPKYLLSKYLNSIGTSQTKVKQTSKHDDNFTKEVSEALTINFPEAQIISSFMLGGLEIDLIIILKGKTHCIDLIGYPGNFAPMFSVEKIKMLKRMDLDVFLLAYSDWNLNREKSIKELTRFIN